MRRPWRRAAAVVVAALALVAPTAGEARGIDAARLRALVAAAVRDPAALRELRAVTAVDGVPVDLGAALRGVDGARLRARLDALRSGAGGPAATGEAAGARAAAAQILAGSRFHAPRRWRPLRAALDWLGARLSPLGRPFRALSRLLGHTTALLVVSLLGVLAIALVAAPLVRRRGGRVAAAARRAARGDGEDPERLERAADDAERRGERERALRLRFRAGLARLARVGALPADRAVTTGEATALLRSERFTRLAGRFDEVVYGGRDAADEDLREAHREWPTVVAEARRGEGR